MIVLLVIALMAVATPMALMVFLLFTVSGRRVMMRRQLDGRSSDLRSTSHSTR
jgi:hypothetical protein